MDTINTYLENSKAIYLIFRSLLESGFTEDQALKILLTMITVEGSKSK
jgi:hypothetical protein